MASLKVNNSVKIIVRCTIETVVTRSWSTFDEGVTSRSPRAAADRVVIDDAALGFGSTDSSARIGALLIDAGPCRFAVRVDQALRSASGRLAEIPGLAGANRATTNFAAEAVWACFKVQHKKKPSRLKVCQQLTTRRRLARLALLLDDRFRRPRRSDRNDPAGLERIASVVVGAEARGLVVDHAALGVAAAQSRARISALLVGAHLG